MLTRLRVVVLPTLLLLTLIMAPRALLSGLGDVPPAFKLREGTDWDYDGPSRSSARVRAAHAAKDAVVDALFAAAGVEFPPARMLFRVYKEEMELQVWAASQRDSDLMRVATYEICAGSGGPGPKRRQGDLQVPEGFYTLDLFNPHSRFYLSMRISYPNKSDRIRGGSDPGGAIMIHGSCVSIGCLAMTDERIQELWVMASAMQKRGRTVHVHSFPGKDLDAFIADEPNLARKAFWTNLKEGHDYVTQKRRLPRVRIDRKGRYSFK